MSERDETTAEKLAAALKARADWLDLPRDVEAPRPYISREQFRAAANLLDEIERLREALIAVLADMPIIDCDGLHHTKKDHHEYGTCPVETRLEAAIDRARAALKAPTL